FFSFFCFFCFFLFLFFFFLFLIFFFFFFFFFNDTATTEIYTLSLHDAFPIFSGIPSDPRVVMAVRELVADHAEDEGRHHAYFSRLLEFTWPRLNKAQRATIGPLLPEMVLAF